LSKNIEQVKALGHGKAVTFCAKTSTKTAKFTTPVFEALELIRENLHAIL
jgi:hypothetical protein